MGVCIVSFEFPRLAATEPLITRCVTNFNTTTTPRRLVHCILPILDQRWHQCPARMHCVHRSGRRREPDKAQRAADKFFFGCCPWWPWRIVDLLLRSEICTSWSRELVCNLLAYICYCGMLLLRLIVGRAVCRRRQGGSWWR